MFEIFDSVKEFVEQHIDLIEDVNMYKLFTIAMEEIPATHELSELATILETIGLDTEDVRWSIFDTEVQNYIKYYLLNQHHQDDKAHSWARVDYMLEEINDMGFGWDVAKKHVVDNGKLYSTTVTPLEPGYGWFGAGDYAFKWFDKKAFEKEYWQDE